MVITKIPDLLGILLAIKNQRQLKRMADFGKVFIFLFLPVLSYAQGSVLEITP